MLSSCSNKLKLAFIIVTSIVWDREGTVAHSHYVFLMGFCQIVLKLVGTKEGDVQTVPFCILILQM